MRKVTWIMLGIASIAAVAVAGCSSDDSSTPSGNTSSGGTTGTLYERLGKKDGIAKAVDAIVQEELKDPEIASYFFFQTTAAAGHPTPAQIEECLTNQLGAAAGGPEKYPTTVSGGFTCRSMVATHAKLGIPNGVFDKFVTIAAGVLKTAGVADADITTVGGVLVGTKGDVVTDTTRDGGAFKQ